MLEYARRIEVRMVAMFVVLDNETHEEVARTESNEEAKRIAGWGAHA